METMFKQLRASVLAALCVIGYDVILVSGEQLPAGVTEFGLMRTNNGQKQILESSSIMRRESQQRRFENSGTSMVQQDIYVPAARKLKCPEGARCSNYDSKDLECTSHAEDIDSEKLTMAFHVLGYSEGHEYELLRSNNKCSSRCTEVYFRKGHIVFEVKGNAPLRQQFRHHFKPRTLYDVALSYNAGEKWVKLYLSGNLVQTLEYSVAHSAVVSNGRLGCTTNRRPDKYGFQGVIENFYAVAMTFEKDAPKKSHRAHHKVHHRRRHKRHHKRHHAKRHHPKRHHPKRHHPKRHHKRHNNRHHSKRHQKHHRKRHHKSSKTRQHERHHRRHHRKRNQKHHANRHKKHKHARHLKSKASAGDKANKMDDDEAKVATDAEAAADAKRLAIAKAKDVADADANVATEAKAAANAKALSAAYAKALADAKAKADADAKAVAYAKAVADAKGKAAAASSAKVATDAKALAHSKTPKHHRKRHQKASKRRQHRMAGRDDADGYASERKRNEQDEDEKKFASDERKQDSDNAKDEPAFSTAQPSTTQTTTPAYNKNVRRGWCAPWKEGTSVTVVGDTSGVSYFPSNWKRGKSLSAQECYDKCSGDDACEQAVYRLKDGKCWLGTNHLPNDPGVKGWKSGCADCNDLCFAKNGYGYTPKWGVRPGMCDPWQEGHGPKGINKGDCNKDSKDIEEQLKCSHWPSSFGLTEKGCFAKCEAHPYCEQAAYDAHSHDCRIGVQKIEKDPGDSGWASRAGCQDACYAKHGFGTKNMVTAIKDKTIR